MSVKSKTYADQMNDAQLMSTALGTNLQTLAKRGMTQEFIMQLNNTLGVAVLQNAEQERLKAELRAATAAFETTMIQLHEQMREAKKVVKLEVPQPLWIEYGIADKR